MGGSTSQGSGIRRYWDLYDAQLVAIEYDWALTQLEYELAQASG
jgi:hypothetical protein